MNRRKQRRKRNSPIFSSRPTRSAKGILALALLILGFTVFYVGQMSFLFENGLSRSTVDMASINQAIWNTSQGRPLQATIRYEGFRNHLEPILVFYSLNYLLGGGIYSLFYLHSLLIALGAIPIYLIVIRRTRPPWEALCAALLYLEKFYKILVDHNPEYPWQPKKFLNLELPGGKLSGTFGFPYFREWKEIRGWFMQNQKTDTVIATNEKIIITRFYLPPTMQYEFADREYLKRMSYSDKIILLLIENPQSWRRTFLGLSLEEWKNAAKPVKVFLDKSGKLQGSIYDLTKEEIKKLLQLKRFNTRISIEPLSGGL